MTLLIRLQLLAQEDAYVHMGRRFREDAGQDGRQLVFGLIFLGIFALAVWVLMQIIHWRERRGFCSAQGLFRQLCRAHGLDSRSRRLLRQLAAWHALEQPGRLFLEPERFDVSQAASQLQAHRQDVEALRDMIFGQKFEAANA